MSKTNGKRLSIEDINKQQAQLQAQLQALAAQAEEVRNAELREIEERVNGLPKAFGVPTLSDVRNLILKVEKGVLFKTAPDSVVGERAPRKVLSEDESKAMIEERRGGAQYSDLAKRYGVSTQTVFNHCKAAGLTSTRAASEAAPVASAPVAETAPQASA